MIYDDNDIPIAMFSYLHFPHPKSKNIKMGHRTVINPNYQGIGIGNRLIEFGAKDLLKKGFRYLATTSSPSIIAYRKQSDKWKCTRKGYIGKLGKTSKIAMAKSSSRYTTSWEFINNNNENKES